MATFPKTTSIYLEKSAVFSVKIKIKYRTYTCIYSKYLLSYIKIYPFALDIDLPSLRPLFLLKPLSMDFQIAFFTIMVFHTASLVTNELTSQ